MGNIVGIDLGTTNTVVAILDITGKPKIQPNSLGQNMTPSAVWINEKDSSTIIGTEAIKQGEMGIPIYQNYKRDIAQNIIYKTVNGTEITPERLSTLVLKKCKDDLDNDGGTDEETTNCVITYPANFTNESREATVAAGKLAEWPIGLGINEPTAAGLYFAYTHKVDAGTYAVYDFGGGTWDISVVKIKGQEVNVIDTEGIPKCGGRDFDSRLQSLIEEKYKEETGNDIDYNLNEKSIYENLKKSLTVADERHVSIKRAAGAPQLITVTRDEFSQAIASLLVGTEMVCEALFEKHPDIKDVFLVGGSTRVPAVKESLENKFGKPGLTIGNPDEIIALGAAIYSGINSKEDLNAAQKQNLDSVEFTETASQNFGVAAVMADEDTGRMSIRPSWIIDKGTELPTEETKPYTTTTDDQKVVSLQVLECSEPEDEMEYVNIIWEGEMNLPAGVKQGDAIEVTFKKNEDQRLDCKFIHMKTKETVEVSLNDKYKVTEEEKGEIEKFTLE